MNNKVIAGVVIVILIVVGLPLAAKLMQQGKATASATPGAAPASGAGTVSAATELVSAMSKGDFAAATARFDATMKAALGPDKLQAVWGELVAKQGAFKSQIGTKTDKKQGFDVVYVNCEFERGKIALQVAFNNAQQIAGLYVVPYVP